MKRTKPMPKASVVARAARRKRLPAPARPSAQFRLTRSERAILADPNWVTEDEADIIYCMRHEQEPTVPLEEVAKELGLPLED